jgi:hypothetical protein
MNGVAALTLPDVDEDWSSWLDGRCPGQLAEARRLVDEKPSRVGSTARLRLLNGRHYL